MLYIEIECHDHKAKKFSTLGYSVIGYVLYDPSYKREMILEFPNGKRKRILTAWTKRISVFDQSTRKLLKEESKHASAMVAEMWKEQNSGATQQ